MDSFLIVASFFAAWIFVSKTARKAGKSGVHAHGGGFLAGCIAMIIMSVIVAPKTSDKGVIVSESQYGDRWPLKVKEARLDCDPPSTAWFEANGQRYALNGKALRSGIARPDEIQKDKNSMFLADFTEKAMQICLDKTPSPYK